MRIHINFRKKRNIVLRQSLSHAVRMTAPFTQGSLGRSRARGFFDRLKSPLPLAKGICYMKCALQRMKLLRSEVCFAQEGTSARDMRTSLHMSMANTSLRRMPQLHVCASKHFMGGYLIAPGSLAEKSANPLLTNDTTCCIVLHVERHTTHKTETAVIRDFS